MINKLLKPSLFRRLFFWQMLVILLALAINFVWSVWSQVYAPGSGGIDHDMRLQVNAVAAFSALNPTPGHADAVAREVRRLNAGSTSFKATDADFGWQVWSAAGELLSSDGLTGSFAPCPPGSMDALVRYQRGNWLIMGNSSADGKLWVVVGQTQAFLSQLDRKLVLQAFVVPLVYAIVLLLALWVAAWQGLRPLQVLGERIATHPAGSAEPVGNAATHLLELMPITQALDGYAQREAHLRAQEKRFFADAAHELRTPLAAIGAQAHVLSHEQAPDLQAQALAALQSGVQRAGDVLTKVLMLSRMDAADADLPLTDTVDVPCLLRDRVAEHAPRCLVTRHNLGLMDGPSLQVLGNRAMLAAALDNLIDNALRYTPPGSQVDIAWGTDSSHAWITVEDDGPGIALPDQDRVFERFERGSNANQTIGSGLGLAIARGVAVLHGGALELEARPDGQPGCQFVMQLPSA
jgi:signal transduction histidine kinase